MLELMNAPSARRVRRGRRHRRRSRLADDAERRRRARTSACLERDGRLNGYVDTDPDPATTYRLMAACDLEGRPGRAAPSCGRRAEERAARARRVAGLLRVYTASDDARTPALFDARGSELRPALLPDGDRPRRRAPAPAWPEAITVATATADDSAAVYEASSRVCSPTLGDPIASRSTSGRTGTSSTTATTPRSGSSPTAGDEIAGVSLCRDPGDAERSAGSACSASGGLAPPRARRGAAAPLVRARSASVG